MWNETVLYASREGKKYPDDYTEVFYEDLPEKARSIVKGIWEWIGAENSEALFEKMPAFENRNYKWKTEFTGEEVAAIEEVADEALTHFGYLRRG
jgi:hypothetical protein